MLVSKEAIKLQCFNNSANIGYEYKCNFITLNPLTVVRFSKTDDFLFKIANSFISRIKMI